MSQQRFNQSGYPIKECKECKRDFNINSFSKIDNNLCVICYEDINDIKVWEITEGDYNDVYDKSIIKATGKQIEEYIKDQFKNPKDARDIGNDSIGYAIIDKEGDYIYYVDAVEIEDYNKDKDGNVDIDLTNNNEVEW